MFVFPAFLSLSADILNIVVYFQRPELWTIEQQQSPARLLDLSHSSFDLVLTAVFRLVFLVPHIWRFSRRLHTVYHLIPWTWQAANIAFVSARLVFLLGYSIPFNLHYVLVILSYISIVFQAVCLEHLRSSAPSEKRIFLAGAVDRVDVSTRLLDSTSSHPSQGELYDGHQQDLDFIDQITVKMKRAKEYWASKTEALRVYFHDLSRPRDIQTFVFDLILRLFTYEKILRELDEAFCEEPSAVEFYIPQLVTFLLYGAYWSSASLQDFLLDKCSQSIQFAHRLYWFLGASCLHGSGIDEQGKQQVTQLIYEVKQRGQAGAYKLEHGQTVQEIKGLPAPALPTAESGVRRERSPRESTESSSNASVEEKDVHSGDSPPPSLRRQLYEGLRRSEVTSSPGSHSAPPQDPPMPACNLMRVFLEAGALRGADGRDEDMFTVLPNFVNKLMKVAEDLMGVPRERRNETLRQKLSNLSQQSLPSNLTYLPLGNQYHRIWRIHARESFCFSTRERVPCLICLEVVDYASPRRSSEKRRWWSVERLGQLPQMSHTFRIGPKKFTLKIGENKPEKGAPPSPYTTLEAPTFLQTRSTLPVTPHLPHLEASLPHLPPEGPYPASVERMGQWASDRAGTPRDPSCTVSPDKAESKIAAAAAGSADLEAGLADAKENQEGEYGSGEVGRPLSPLDARDDGTGDGYGTFSPVDSPTYEVEQQEEHGFRNTDRNSLDKAVGQIWNRETEGSGGVDPTSATSWPPVIFKERWRQKEARLRKQSPIGHLPRWRLLPVIVKAKDDLRQEQFASQMLRQIESIVRLAKIPVWLRPYDIIATSFDGGLIEAIPDTVSLDALRKNDSHYTTLSEFFERLFAQRRPDGLLKAKQCFVESLAAYSIICFILQIKDRHNGNILLDAAGHIIHIDFGFMLARSPGNVGFEKAPFKLTSEFVELMEGPRSALFKRFRDLCGKMFMELRRQRHKIILLVEMTVNGNEHLPCFGVRPQATVEALRQRFQPDLNDRACIEYVNSLIDHSLDNWRTRWYDRYQSCFVGIA